MLTQKSLPEKREGEKLKEKDGMAVETTPAQARDLPWEQQCSRGDTQPQGILRRKRIAKRHFRGCAASGFESLFSWRPLKQRAHGTQHVRSTFPREVCFGRPWSLQAQPQQRSFPRDLHPRFGAAVSVLRHRLIDAVSQLPQFNVSKSSLCSIPTAAASMRDGDIVSTPSMVAMLAGALLTQCIVRLWLCRHFPPYITSVSPTVGYQQNARLRDSQMVAPVEST